MRVWETQNVMLARRIAHFLFVYKGGPTVLAPSRRPWVVLLLLIIILSAGAVCGLLLDRKRFIRQGSVT
jgi:hypothetical protein